MKLTTLFVLLTTLQLSANMYSQNARVTLSVTNGTLSDIFKEIEKQTEYKIFYKVDQINLQARLTCTANDQAVSDVLGKVLPENGATYDVIDKIIVITPAIKQNQKVTGAVTDSKGQPLPGVSVSVKGTSAGSITDADGKYSVEVPDGNAVLVFSFIGFLPEEKVVGTQTSINITMIEDIKQLEEVVVVGYGTVKKSDLTGSVSRVGAKEIEESPVQNVVQAMQGRAAGMDISSNERPGEMGNIRIRGNRSLTATNNPLYVVDGIPLAAGGIEAFNPNDIESIDVLKDASATAIYGSRGANGVIIVTTKKGQAGKATFSYNSTLTFEKINDLSKNFNSAEYVEFRRDAYRAWKVGVAQVPQYPAAPDYARDKAIFGVDPFAWANIDNAWAGGTYDPSKLTNTNWTDYVERTGITQNHTLSVSAGTEKMRSYVSMGYLDQKGTNIDQDYKRYTGQANLELKPVKWFTFGAGITGTWSQQHYGYAATNTGAKLLYDAAKAMLPFAVPYDTAGNFIYLPGGDVGIINPIKEGDNSINERNTLRLLGSFFGEVKFTNWLKYRINFGPDFRNFRRGEFRKGLSIYQGGTPTSPNYARLYNSQNFAYTLDNLLYFDKTFNNIHTIGVTLLQSSSLNRFEDADMTAAQLPDDSQLWYGLQQTQKGALDAYASSFRKSTLMSYMVRANYSLMDKYLLTASGRWDGSSVFAPGHKWDFFPSFALAWKIQNEDFLKPITWVSELKARVGYGTTGNSAVAPYSTLGGLNSVFYRWGGSAAGTVANGFLPCIPSLANPALMPNLDLRWEKTSQWNFGLDFGLFSNRISGSLEFYIANTSDLLMNRSLPSVTGYVKTLFNVGKTRNRGVEVTLTTVNIDKKDFKWTTDLTFSTNKESLVELSNGKVDDMSNNWFIGQPASVYYDFVKVGVWQLADSSVRKRYNTIGNTNFQNGDIRLADLNGDSIIDPNHDRKVIGTDRPLFTTGMVNTFKYKGWDLSFFVYSRWGQMITGGSLDLQGRYASRKVNYWTPTNPTNDYPSPNYSLGGVIPYMSSMNYLDASFVKVKYISLGYTFPSKWMQKFKVTGLRFYVQVLNPFLFSKTGFIDPDYSTSVDSNNATATSSDPNTAVSTSVSSRSYVLGLNLSF